MNNIRVSPDEVHPTHHLSILNPATGEEIGLIVANANGDANALGMGAAPLERTAIKTTQGNQSWGDMEYPWTSVAQETFAGGRGQEKIESDMSKFAKSLGLTTAYGFASLGGMETLATGYRKHNFSLPGSLEWTSLLDNNYWARKISITTGYTLAYVSIPMRKVGNPTANLTVSLHSDSSGDPGSAIVTATVTPATFTDVISELYRMALSTTLSSSTSYWLKVYSSGDLDNHWEVGTKIDVGNITTKYSNNNSTWLNCDIDLFFLLNDAEDSTLRTRFFSYKYLTYVLRGKWGSAPSLYCIGDRGVADPNTGALGTLIDATKTWTTDQWAGYVVRITNGTGIDEQDLYRTIVSNTATTLTLDRDFTIAHDTTTEYIIQGGTKLFEITGHGLTNWVTSTLVINGYMYFAQGDDIAIQRGQWTAASGYQWAADGTNKATFMCLVRDLSNGYEIWKANNLDGSSPRVKSTAKAALPTSWANLSFGTAIPLPDLTGRINSIREFKVNSSPTLFAFTEGAIWYLYSNKWVEMTPEEFRTMTGSRNGSAVIVNDVYLYTSYGYGIERYLDTSLDDVGMNRDAGLPPIETGFVSCMLSYPGRYFASVDAGTTGKSGIYMYNQSGWSEIYRCPTAGMRIHTMFFETIEGNQPDRLWFNCGNDIMYIPFPSYYVDPTKDTLFPFRYEGYLETSYIYAGMFDIWKLFNYLTVHSEMMNERQYVEADYMLDTDTTWTPLPDRFDSYPAAESPVGDEGISGKRIKLRFRFYTKDWNLSPKVIAYVLEVISHIPVRYGFSCDFRVRDRDKLLDGVSVEETLEWDKVTLLLNWAEHLTPLVLHSTDPEYHDWKIFINPIPIKKFLGGETGHICTLTATQRRRHDRIVISG